MGLLTSFSMLLFITIGWGQTFSLSEIHGIEIESYVEIIEMSYGDLDGDTIAEMVLVVNRSDSSDFNVPRDLMVLKQKDATWHLWKISSHAILGTDEGGVLGDPFQGAYAEDHMIHISHSGGSNWRWSETSVYGFRDHEFLLNSHESYFGSFCDEKIEIRFDLVTGEVNYSVDIEACPEGFGDNSHLLESLPHTEVFLHPDLKIKLFDVKDTIVEITTPNNQVFSISH
jgi:hypothetical protein